MRFLLKSVDVITTPKYVLSIKDAYIVIGMETEATSFTVFCVILIEYVPIPPLLLPREVIYVFGLIYNNEFCKYFVEDNN